jgi:hypothetical protein
MTEETAYGQSDDRMRWVALFFLFTFLDEKTAVAAAESATAQLKALPPAPGPLVDEMARRVELITILRKTFDQNRKNLARNRPVSMADSVWTLPEGIDLRAWIKFHKDSSDGEIISVVLSKILGFTDYEIADGLNISLGTARYRIGKGMRQLGESLRAGAHA